MVGKITDKELLIFRNEGLTLKDISIQAGVSICRISQRLIAIESRVLELVAKGHSGSESALMVGCGEHHVNRYLNMINRKYK